MNYQNKEPIILLIVVKKRSITIKNKTVPHVIVNKNKTIRNQ
jgi:hypothetical protein